MPPKPEEVGADVFSDKGCRDKVRSQHELLWGCDLVTCMFVPENRSCLVRSLGNPKEFLCLNAEVMRRCGLLAEKNGIQVCKAGLEQPGLVKGIPAHGRGLELGATQAIL